MRTPVHCTQCVVPIPKLCPHLSATKLVGNLLESETTQAQIEATIALVIYIEELQLAVRHPPPAAPLKRHRPMWATKTDDILDELKKSEIVSTAQMPTVFNILSKHLGRKP